ncbi:RNA pseudouridylate synthase domain containing protein 2 [Sorochytrium milnesiophthora]
MSRSYPLERPLFAFANGLRYVRPYRFQYETTVKERWLHKGLLDVFAKELKRYTRDQYAEMIQQGTLRVNDRVVDPTYELRHGDVIYCTVYRFDPPITDEPLRKLYDDGEVITFFKPSSIPMHPNSLFHYNTVTEILKHDHGLHNLSVHRLDALTCGLVVFARNSTTAGKLAIEMRTQETEKQYFARVVGSPSWSTADLRVPISRRIDKSGPSAVPPHLHGKSHHVHTNLQAGHLSITANGAPDEASASTLRTLLAHSQFSVVAHQSLSLVKCKPVTGRMHQLRVHLAYLGHPIRNDPLYNPHFAQYIAPDEWMHAHAEPALLQETRSQSEQPLHVPARSEIHAHPACLQGGEPVVRHPTIESLLRAPFINSIDLFAQSYTFKRLGLSFAVDKERDWPKWMTSE